MSFTSSIFLLLFFPIAVLGYYFINPRLKNYFLLAMSLVFYSWGEPKFIVVMLISVLINYLLALAINFGKKKQISGLSKFALVISIIWNVSLIFIYKYLNFAIMNFNNIFGAELALKNIALPIGISFFTFQAMSYVIDVYRGNGQVLKNPLNVALYLTFFPQLVAGPIVRYETVASEIKQRHENIDDFTYGIKRFVIGLSKKLLISNQVAVVADAAFNSSGKNTVLFAWVGAIAYSLQIYFDFSGYSDMAIGLGRMFGFHFNENFNNPYCSSSVSDFWRRWHISLGTWFRDYVYFPLGGSRVNSKYRLLFNLFVTWTLTGVWHGANWTFILWGLMYFVLLSFEKITGVTKKLKTTWQKALYRAFTLLCVIFGWVLFRSDNVNLAMSYFSDMFGISGNGLSASLEDFSGKLISIVLAIALCLPIYDKIKELVYKNSRAELAVKYLIQPIGCIILLIMGVSCALLSDYDPFIYFNF